MISSAADVPDIQVGKWIAYGLELMEKYTTLITGCGADMRERKEE